MSSTHGYDREGFLSEFVTGVRDLISRVTDKVIEALAAWQSRPLDRLHPVMLIEAIDVKIRDGQVANRPVYIAVGSSWQANATCWACGSALDATRDTGLVRGGRAERIT